MADRDAERPARWTLLAGGELLDLDADARPLGREPWRPADAAELIAARPRTRWTWVDTAHAYPEVLAAGLLVERAWDLRLARRILRLTPLAASHSPWPGPDRWDLPATAPDGGEALFAFDEVPPVTADDAAAELRHQLDVVARASDPPRLRLLLNAESAGALIAAEMHAAGLPWDRPTHEAILVDTLGARPAGGGHPVRMQQLAERVRTALGDPTLSLDSPPRLLRGLHRAGLTVTSTSKWELGEIDHPVVEPLLEYKRMARLLTANGWTWLDEWTRDGRFRPVYVPAGVVTGRWASSGGGALQIPRQLRPAVRPDPGWAIVDADVAQLEPRVLAAMARDRRMADAARGRDLYEGIVATGAVATREEAKYAVLGAMYGATTGDSGRLVPRLRQTFPAAMALVDGAAVSGEDGGGVATWLGRGTPLPESEWAQQQAEASEADADAATRERARRWARDRGRFTRNFVVQGTAAEWALCWLAEIRRRLAQLPPSPGAAASRSGPAFSRRAHLVFFLHDEVIVHCPAEQADTVREIVEAAASAAGRHLFGSFPVDFPLDVTIDRASDADGAG